MSKYTAPYGSWKSPITVSMLTQSGIGLSEVRIDGDTVYWVEDRPLEEGRSVLVCSHEGSHRDVTPPGFSVRTRAHEYGGGAYTVEAGVVFFVNDQDQRVYRQEPRGEPVALTPEAQRVGALRYADLQVAPGGRFIVCVRESHPETGEAVHELVALPTDGSGAVVALASGCDFYSSPSLTPDGTRLAWLSWQHPQMPWDGTELFVAGAQLDGAVSLTDPVKVAGGPRESVFQPQWGTDGALYFISDRTGFWNLYSWRDGGEMKPMAPREADYGAAQWVFGQSRFAMLSGGRIACVYSLEGRDHLEILDSGGAQPRQISLPFTSFGRGGELHSDTEETLVFVGASAEESASVVRLDVSTGRWRVVRKGLEVNLERGHLSVPRAIEFPTAGGLTAHAFFYPPTNRDYEADAGERPPLLVVGHGGPTSQTSAELKLTTQFWTSRGFAVVDVNYGGSTGYGRRYRERLRGNWGIVDTEDCVNAARFLADRGLVDRHRMAIRGASAGGYTTLCALVFHDVFAAGASYYGVADAEALAQDTHKFESRYLDGLIGPYPEARELYRKRSPIHFADRLSCPVILLQGSDDRVVPPEQAEVFVEALRSKGLPVAYLRFEGEAHGFRRADTIRRALEGELSFYAQLFGFEPADPLEKVHIENRQ